MVAQTNNSLTTAASAMIRLSDISSALEVLKDRREDSANSLSSWTTTVATPPIITGYASSSSGSSSSSVIASPYGSMRGSSTSAGARSVRFADECGGDLVSDVQTTANWWEEMVLGVDRCEACGHKQRQQAKPPTTTTAAAAATTSFGSGPGASSSSSASFAEAALNHESSAQLAAPTCERCGVRRREGSPSELFRFIEELSRGVEATLTFPAIVGKKRRSVILYTEDNGESICWMKTGGKPGQPYRLPCKTLLEVKDKAGATMRVGAVGVGQRRQPVAAAAGGAPLAGFGTGLRRATLTRRASGILGLRGGGGAEGKAPRGRTSSGDEGGTVSSSTSYSSSSSEEEEEEEERGGAEGGCDTPDADRGPGGACEVRIRLTWRLKPTWSAQKVTIENVSCSSPAVFTRGMMQLRSHNMDLQR